MPYVNRGGYTLAQVVSRDTAWSGNFINYVYIIKIQKQNNF